MERGLTPMGRELTQRPRFLNQSLTSWRMKVATEKRIKPTQPECELLRRIDPLSQTGQNLCQRVETITVKMGER